ncbi:MAG TPA: iron-sulfur cluster assembly scaffold protein [Candidatus Nanoarchaeia archaeon]|nr:iron-sulfur cluster assembly scaffold protein [Candidatus Nanoarchaeia archaeon]
MYTDKVIEEFRNPSNLGRLENADGKGEIGNPTCGDMLYVYIKVKNNILTDIKVETFGCVAAVATSSMLTKIVKGKTLEEAEKVTKEQIAKELGGLPPIKMHCSILAVDGLKKAIQDYRSKI